MLNFGASKPRVRGGPRPPGPPPGSAPDYNGSVKTCLVKNSQISPKRAHPWCHRMWSLNRQLQCKSVKIYRAQTPQNLALTKILHKFRKMSAPLSVLPFTRDVCQMPPGQTPPGQNPPGRHPLAETPLGRHPRADTPQQRPLG